MYLAMAPEPAMAMRMMVECGKKGLLQMNMEVDDETISSVYAETWFVLYLGSVQ